MTKKLNLYTGLLIAAVIFLALTSVFHYNVSYSSTINEGEKLEFVDMPKEFYTCDSIEGGVRYNWLPTFDFEVNVRNKHIGGHRVLMSTNHENEEKFGNFRQNYLVEMQKVKLKMPMSDAKFKGVTFVLGAIAILIGMVMYGWVVIMVILLLLKIRKGEVFVSKVSKYLETTGILLTINYVWQFVTSYSLTKVFQNAIEIAEYDIVFKNECNSMILLMGLTLMVISQVILMGKDMKEEQELTI